MKNKIRLTPSTLLVLILYCFLLCVVVPPGIVSLYKNPKDIILMITMIFVFFVFTPIVFWRSHSYKCY